LKKKFKYYFLLFTIIQYGVNAAAQSGFGQPVFKQDFGFGDFNPSTIGTVLPAAKTDFLFSNTVCPPPGSYTIIRRVPVANCFNNEWIPLSHDNNPALEYGMMMVINNTTTLTNKMVYQDTVDKPMCPGEIYNLSAALINLDPIGGDCPNNTDFPVFELRLEDETGRVINKDTTRPGIVYASPPPFGYKFIDFGFNFFMPGGVNKLVIKLILLRSTYWCAEDFAIDDIVVRPVGPGVDIGFLGEPTTTIVKSVCFQDNKMITLTGNMEAFYPNPVVQWQQSTDNGVTWLDIPGANAVNYSRVFSVPDTFLYRLSGGDARTVANPNCRVVSNVIKVDVDGLPTGYTITNNSPVCAGQDLKFTASGAASYVWTGPNGFYDNIPFPHIFFSSLADSGMYYVDVTSLGGCIKKDSTYATVIGTDVHARPDTAICKGQSVKLETSKGITYLWTPPTALSAINVQYPRAKPEITTTYTVKVTDSFGCSDTAMVQVRVVNKVEVKAKIEANNYLCRSFDSLSFSSQKSLGQINSWNWNFGNGQISLVKDPPVQHYSVAASENSLVARLIVKDTTGCTDTAYHFITIADNCYIAVPSAFTPNNDGLNDYLYPLNAYKATNLIFRIYNRNGQIVFETKDWTRKWDGKINGIEQNTGVYIWMLDYNDASGKRKSLKGTSVLIR
jgi:gliding motility-associated-like protein